MYRKLIILTPDKPNFPLESIWIGQGSDGVVVIPNVPAGCTASLILTPIGGGRLVRDASSVTTFGQEIYLPGWPFPTVGQTRYEIKLTQGEGDLERTFWAGQSFLNVWSSSLDAAEAPPMPDGQYWRMPSTGLYHLIKLAVDPDTKKPTFDISEEGLTHVP